MRKASGILLVLLALVGVWVGLSTAQMNPEEVQQLSLIHSLSVGQGAPTVFPDVVTVRVNKPVRLYNISADKPGEIHDPVVISSDELGKNPVFGVRGFKVEPGKVTVVEFTPTQTGTFFITHLQHAHPIVAKLIVKD